MTYVPPLSGARINASLSGNSTSGGGGYQLVSTGTLFLAGGNNVTLSQNAASVTISGFNPSFSAGGGATTFKTLNFTNSNGVSFTNTGGSLAASVKTDYAGTGTTFAGANVSGSITQNTAGLNLSLSAGAGGAAGSNTFGISNIGNTAGTSGIINGSAEQLLFAGGNNVTLSQSINGASATITISGANTVAQTNQSAIKGLGVSNTGQTAGNTGVSTGIDWVLAGSQSLTLSQSTAGGGPNTVWFQHPAWLTTARASNDALGLNTAQNNVTWTANSAGLSLDARGYAGTGTTFNGANLSGSITQNSAGLNLSLSAANAAQGSDSIGMHTSTAGGGTGGTSGSAQGSQIDYNFYAGSNITLSQSINGASGSLSIYGTSGGGGGGVVLYDGANSISSGTAMLSDANGVSFGINGQTITASVNAGGGAVSRRWQEVYIRPIISNMTNLSNINGTPIFQPFFVEGTLSLSRLNWEMSRATSGSNNFSVYAGIYQYNNNTQISLLASGSGFYSNSATASISGVRRFGLSGFNTSTFSEGGYVLGMMFTAANTLSMNYSLRGGQTSAPQLGAILEGSDQYNTATSYNIFPFWGRYTAASTALPNAVADADIRGQFSGASQALNWWVGMNND